MSEGGGSSMHPASVLCVPVAPTTGKCSFFPLLPRLYVIDFEDNLGIDGLCPSRGCLNLLNPLFLCPLHLHYSAPCSLGLVLPNYSEYHIRANLSDQILQVQCKYRWSADTVPTPTPQPQTPQWPLPPLLCSSPLLHSSPSAP